MSAPLRRLAPMLTTKPGASKTDYGTPTALYDRMDALFRFTIDLAAQPHNHKHARYYSPKENSLAQSWETETGWLNPPYGRHIGDWMAKARDSAIEERAIICMLLPARVGSRWWRRYVLCADGAAGRLRSSAYVPETEVLWLRWEGLVTGVHFLSGRVTFDGDAEEAAPFDTALVWHASPGRAVPKAAAETGSLLWGWPR